MPDFHIRPASLAAGDDRRLLRFMDSQLPWLASMGSESQWGSQPFSDNEKSQAKYRAKVARSEAQMGHAFGPDWIRVYIAEADVTATDLSVQLRESPVDALNGTVDGSLRIPVAAMILDSKFADYVLPFLPEQDESNPFIFMATLVTDRGAHAVGQGAGSFLIDHAKAEARRMGLRRVCADCWRGNEHRLVKYYERQGFQAIGNVGNDAEGDWPGTILEMRL